MKILHKRMLGGVLLLCAVSLGPAAAATGVYQGEISAAHNREFFQRVKNKTIERLVISSTGGEVEAGIELGLWVYRQQLTLEVQDICLSSCANYVFTAAARKIILPGAVVAWHGNYHHLKQTGLWRDDIPKRMQRTGESRAAASQKVWQQVQHLVQAEAVFFQTIGVDQYVCWIGKMPPYSARNYYLLSPADMTRFGVKQVQAPQNYAKTDLRKYDVSLEFVRLNRD